MPPARRRHAPKLEPELFNPGDGSASLGGAMASAEDQGRVSGSQADGMGANAPLTITLCDGSQFTFARLVDLRTSADIARK